MRATASLECIWLCALMVIAAAQRSYDFSAVKVRLVSSPHSQSYEWFGSRVDISGDYMVVGAPGSDSSKLVGYAYVYRRDTDNKWHKVAQLAGSSSSDGFGSVVRIQGSNIVVGAYKDNSLGTAAGCVYHFSSGENGFTQQQKITAYDGSAGDYFGASVAMYNREELLVGAWGQTVDGYAAAGAAYFYRYRDGAWRFEAKFTGENPTLYQWYGISVALYASKGVVGAWGDAAGGSLAGAIYAYNHITGVWVYMQCIKGNAGDQLGYSLSMNSDVLIAGAPSAYRNPLSDNSDGSSSRVGAAFMYRLTDYNHWQYEEVITCKYCAAGDAYGSAVVAEHDSVVVGKIGGADVFQYDSRYSSGYRWTKVTALQTGNDDIDYSLFFGSSIGMDGPFIALGVKDLDSSDGHIEQAGGVIVFTGKYNTTNSATYSALNMAIYVAMYMLVVLGIFVLLAAPAALIAKHLYEDTKAKASLLEMKPFIKGKASNSTANAQQKVSL